VSNTKIEWTDAVWNPVTGCTKISPGCQNCYAERMAKRLAGRYGYPKDEPFRVTLHPERLDLPLKWRRPRRIFVNSMGDLFHADVPSKWIERVWQTMLATDGHIYLILTKRPDRMRRLAGSSPELSLAKNIWLGITAENQATANERIPILLQIPAAVYFISHEPALGSIIYPPEFLALGRKALIITGGESGPGARPMHPDWARLDRDQCVAAGTPFFFKSQGEYCAPSQMPEETYRASVLENGPDTCWNSDDPTPWRVGKKAAGRLLDGRTWDEFPVVQP